jgi:hypothetical protein
MFTNRQPEGAGFRFICHRDGERGCVFSRTGHEWGAQAPAIAAALRTLPGRSVILDGEGVICGLDFVAREEDAIRPEQYHATSCVLCPTRVTDPVE